MVRGGRAEAPVPRSDVSFRLDQKTANFKAAIPRRTMQWSALTEGKQKNELAQKEFRFINTITIIRGGNHLQSFASISALHCSKRRVTSRWPFSAEICSGVHSLKKKKRINLLHENDEKIERGKAGGNYSLLRLLTASASAITWQSTEAPSPFSADSKMSGLPATRALGGMALE